MKCEGYMKLEMVGPYGIAQGEQAHAHTTHTGETPRHKIKHNRTAVGADHGSAGAATLIAYECFEERNYLSPRPLPGFACWQAVVKDCVWMLQLVFLILQLDEEV